MPSDLRILAVASDAGSARALMPAATVLIGRGAVVRFVVSGPSNRIIPAELPGADVVTIAEEQLRQEIVAVELRGHSSDVVLTGAGPYNMLEHAARLAAREAGIPSVAVLDYWFEYRSRFHRRRDGATEESWPDVVCAPDEQARLGLVEAGCSADRIVVTGPPNLEDSVRWSREHPTGRVSLRGPAAFAADAPLVVFFSEPYRAKPDGAKFTGPGGLYRADGTPLFGYTSIDILTQIVEALDRAACHSPPAQLLVKAHPLEWTLPLHELAASRLGCATTMSVIEEANPKELLVLADVVMGMSSVTLLEAALIGKPAYSVQIGASTAPFDPCVGNRLGVTHAIFDSAMLQSAASDILERRTIPRTSAPDGLFIAGASERVADVVASVLARSWP